MRIFHDHAEPFVYHATKDGATTLCDLYMGDNWCEFDAEDEDIPGDAMIALCMTCGIGLVTDGFPIEAIQGILVVERMPDPRLN